MNADRKHGFILASRCESESRAWYHKRHKRKLATKRHIKHKNEDLFERKFVRVSERRFKRVSNLARWLAPSKSAS